ncbi:MAG: glycoside hydrolase family 13 protein, partial [Oscillospiraceae bacterium]|nr:glycoside hydrolase family 13 protein [Oscillospiraceae bacterium]
MKKIFDSWNTKYKKPFGAIKKGEPCEFRIRLPKETVLDFPPVPVMVIFRTGYKETFLSMNLEKEDDDGKVYMATYVPKHAGVHYYYFSYKQNGTRNYIKKTACHESSINFGDLYQLTVYEKEFETPDFLKGGIMYQIFPDRFYKSGKPHENVPEDRVMRENWEDTPYYRPDENGHVWNNDYFGGDLDGIAQKLPYLKSLGVTCIYLNPIFESHENHRYNTANYRKVDPLLGTNNDFRALCAEAKRFGISVILDGVFSHTGADSIYFNKFNRYDSVGAYNSKESEFFPWYTFYEYPDKYEAWWGIDTLPNVQENNREYTEYICGDGGVLDYWISLGAAGYRLDVADELPDEFLDNLNRCVKKHGREKIIIGEVWEDASNKESYGVKRRYLLGSQLDSVMNYPFRSAIMNYVMGGSAYDFRNSIMTIVEN